MQTATVFHPLHGYAMCYGNYDIPADIAASSQPEHGTLVVCGGCRRLGVIPDEGHELRFLPPGTERNPGGGFIFRA